MKYNLSQAYTPLVGNRKIKERLQVINLLERVNPLLFRGWFCFSGRSFFFFLSFKVKHVFLSFFLLETV